MNTRLSSSSPSPLLRTALLWALLGVLLSNAQTSAFVIPRRGLFARNYQGNEKRESNGISPIFRQLRSPRTQHLHKNRSARKISPGSYGLYVNLTVPEAPVGLHEHVVLQCLASGPKPSVVYWLKNGVKISKESTEVSDIEGDSDEGTELTLTQVRSKLYIDCASPDDEATYTCVAVSADGMDSSSYKLQVSNEQSFLSAPLGCRGITKKAFEKLGTPARITMWTYNKLAPIGSNVVLVCHVQGTNAGMSWSNDESPKSITDLNNPRIRVLENGNLEIKDIRWSDMGGYACTTENEAGFDREIAFLYPYAH